MKTRSSAEVFEELNVLLALFHLISESDVKDGKSSKGKKVKV